jgi:hypothetical protein
MKRTILIFFLLFSGSLFSQDFYNETIENNRWAWFHGVGGSALVLGTNIILNKSIDEAVFDTFIIQVVWEAIELFQEQIHRFSNYGGSRGIFFADSVGDTVAALTGAIVIYFVIKLIR